MKTIWGLLMVVALAVVLFGGVSIVNNDIISKNPNLDTSSLEIISTYDNNVANLTTLAGSSYRVDTSLGSNTTNQVDAFFREAAENKQTIEKTRDGIEFLWDLPEIILLSIPLVNVQNNTFLLLFKGMFYFMLSVLILIVLYKGYKGRVDNE